MSKYFRISILISFLVLIAAPTLSALDIPKRPKGYVSDYAAMLSPQTRSGLENALALFERRTTNQLFVVTFPSLEGGSLEDFSIRLAEAWKPGTKDKDNGVIFLIFKDDRKMRIEVGYGLEGTLPDALAGQIIQQVVTPLFQQGDYERGILAGVQAITQATQGEYQAEARSATSTYRGERRKLTPEELEAMRAGQRALGMLIFIAVIIFFIVDFFRYRRYHHDHRLYKGRYSFWEWWFRFAILLAVLSILFRVLFYAMLFSRGGSYGGRSGFGGFSGGGGGGFGGGGASGGW